MDGIAHYKKALLYNSKYPDAWYNLGVAFSEVNDTDEAIISYQVAIQLNPKCAEACNNLGVIYKDIGNLERAITFYQAALAANPCFAQTLNVRANGVLSSVPSHIGLREYVLFAGLW